MCQYIQDEYSNGDYRYACEEAERAEERLDEAKDFFNQMLSVLFGSQPVDDNFLGTIDELAHVLRIKLPKDVNFTIEKKNETLKQISFLLKATI